MSREVGIVEGSRTYEGKVAIKKIKLVTIFGATIAEVKH